MFTMCNSSRNLVIMLLCISTSVMVLGGCDSEGENKRDITTDQSATPHSASSSHRPNILMVLTDDQRYDSLGCTGHPFIKTPYLDRLGQEGAIFDEAFVVTPVCCPSRATILTGLYSQTTGVWSNRTDLDAHRIKLISVYLKELGYATAFIGKWHLGGASHGSDECAFDYTVGFGERHTKSGRFYGKYFDCKMIVNGEVIASKGYNTDVLTNYAIDWITKQDSTPFFLLLWLKSPHAPFEVPPRHKSLYADVNIQLPQSYHDPIESIPQCVKAINERADAAGNWSRIARLELRRLSTRGEPMKEFIREKARMIASVDDCVERLYTALQKVGRLDDTFFMFSSDNGYLLGEHGLVQKKLAYEPSIRIPLIVRYPRLIPMGSRVSGQVLNLDFAPTLIELAGGKIPSRMRGRSLLQLFKSPKAQWRDDWLLISNYLRVRGKYRPWFLGLRTKDWKYVRYLAGGIEEELFDLAHDPDERRNLVGRPQYASRLLEMHDRMRKAMKRERVRAEWWEPFLR